MNSNKNKRMYIIVAVIVGAALAGTFMINTDPVIADGGSANILDDSMTNTASEGVGSMLPSIVKMISALIVVLFALYGSVYLLKKGMGRKLSGNKTGCALEVLESTFVAPRKTISLVRVADRAVLIGITEQQISVLTELSAEQTAVLQSAQIKNPSPNGFSDVLASATRKVKDFRLYRGHRPAEA